MKTIPDGKLDQTLGAQSAALSLRVRRQQVLASNIANADTPGYKAIDFDFGSTLRAATAASSGRATEVAARNQAAVPMQTTAGHLAGQRSAYAGTSTEFRTLYRTPAQPAADGNSVDMDLERARFAENSIRYEAALKFLNGQIKTLMSAITG
jgi:flagellar basal-body rod protein FlgB